MRANIVGYVALFLALSAGAYAAALAPNSVRSKHIKDGHVTGADLAGDAVTGASVLNSSLGGSDLGSNSLGGQQINESSLATVAMAAQGGTGRYGYSGSCDPESQTYVACSTAAVPHSKPGRFLIIAQVTASTEIGSDFALGGCQLEVNEAAIQASRTEFWFHDTGDDFAEFGNEYAHETATLVAVSDVQPAGTQTAGVACYQDSRKGAIVFPNARIVGVSLSDG